MLFKMNLSLLLSALTLSIISCNWDDQESSKAISQTEGSDTVKMHYYNPQFRPDTTSKLRLDGYYQIRQVFGSYTTNDKDYYPNKPTYGYIKFFSDGFCKVGWWNGFFQSPEEIRNQIAENKAFGFWGIYKTDKDTLQVEYLYNPASPGVQYSEQKNTLTALIDNGQIIVTTHDNTKYSYPDNKEALATSSCIGTFVNLKTPYDSSDNYLKKEIGKYQ
jgi:hypothetical protein